MKRPKLKKRCIKLTQRFFSGREEGIRTIAKKPRVNNTF